MENASKALIMGASILIGVALLSVMIYAFSYASKVNSQYDEKEYSKNVKAFNSDFLVYETLNDGIINPDTKNLFKTGTEGTYARFNAAQRLNTISDVVSAVNKAYSINYKNSNQYINNYINYENGMIIVINLKNSNVIEDIVGSSNSKTKYIIFPHPQIESGCVYGMYNADYNALIEKINNHDNNIDLSGYQKLTCNRLLEVFRESRIATTTDNPPDNRNYTLYKYYFTGRLNVNPNTGKIGVVTFTLAIDEKY